MQLEAKHTLRAVLVSLTAQAKVAETRDGALLTARELTALHALSPKAAAAACAVWDAGDAECEVFVAMRGEVLLRLGGGRGVRRKGVRAHCVLVAGGCADVPAGEVWVDAVRGCEGFHCDCQAFAFKQGGEAFCKHIFIAGVALAVRWNVGRVSRVSDECFVALLDDPDYEPQELEGAVCAG